MLLITKVEYKEVSDNPIKVFKANYPDKALFRINGSMIAEEVVREFEIVKGETFVDPKSGVTRTIGMTSEVEGAIGIVIKAVKDQSEYVSRLLRDIMRLETCLQTGLEDFEMFKQMPWLKRLIFLFKGKDFNYAPRSNQRKNH